MTSIAYYSADELRERLPMAKAIAAIRDALAGGFDPAGDPGHAIVPVERGELHLTAAEAFGFTGAKVLSVAPDNPRRRLDRMQGLYVLMDAATLSPRVIVDGSALTNLRTAAMAAVAVDRLAPKTASRLVVFGSGSQARAQIEGMMAVRPIERVVIVARDGYKAEGLAAWAVERGLQARIGQATPTSSAVPDADIIVCASSSAEPLFASELVQPASVVVAVGSHEAGKRELESSLMARADVFVEDVDTASRLAGDVVSALEEGALERSALRTVASLVRGESARTPRRPAVVKLVGMAWQDLVVASAIDRGRGSSGATHHGGIGRAQRR